MALMGEVILLGILLFRSAGRWSWFAARRLSCFVAFLNFKLNNLKLKSNIPQMQYLWFFYRKAYLARLLTPDVVSQPYGLLLVKNGGDRHMTTITKRK